MLVKDLATVKEAPALKRGDGSFNGKPAVVATIQKQPNANTLELTANIEETLASLKPSLPTDVTIDTKAFRQADFIERAVWNVSAALIEGGIMANDHPLPVLELPHYIYLAQAIPLSLLAYPRYELFRRYHQYDDARRDGDRDRGIG